MKQEEKKSQEQKVPFFVRFLEKQQVKSDAKSSERTLKYPSDSDELAH